MQNEPDTAVNRALEQEWYKQLFGVRRSVRYHSYRRQFYLGAQALTSFLIIVLGSGSAMVLFSELDAEWFKILAPMAITVLAALSLVYGLTAKAALHNDLYRRFVDLERDFTRSACEDKQLRRLADRRLEIEMDEPAIYQALNRHCHNELLRSEGRFELMERLQVQHRLFKDILRFDNLPVTQRRTLQGSSQA